MIYGVKMDISKRLKTIRGKLSQEDFAKVMGVSKMTVGRWERGERAPDFENLHKILDIFPNVSPAWLLSGEGPMNKGDQEIEQEGLSDHKLLIAKKFRAIRGDKSIEEFCSDFHWYKEGWWEVEEDLKSPPWVLLYRICHDLGINPAWLIEDEGPMLKADLGIPKNFDLDTDLLALVYEVIDDIDSESHLLSVQQKAELFSFVYQMNRGTKYTKDRLKRFIEAVCIFIEQGIDFNKLSDRKLSNIIIEIAHHVVKGGE